MKKIVVLGGGESGYGSAVLAKLKGFEVFLSDAGMLKREYKTKIEEQQIPYEEGGHTLDKILEASLIIKSPGIPQNADIIQAALARGIKIVSEIEFASKYTKARTICITGSNGKTTTTTLIYEIMRRSGLKVAVAGNIGQSFALAIAMAKEEFDWYVIELSSFQLDGVFDFKADIALLLNITPDHLNRYDYQMSKYVDSKLRILRNQTIEDTFIYNADDPESQMALPKVKIEANPIPFSARGTVGGAWSDGVNLYYKEYSLPIADMQIKGIHNVANALAAIAACMRAGIDFKSIASTLRSFGGVEHRLEAVATISGVEYINDSKATNTDSVWYALESMVKPTIWIAGGTDKGNDYDAIKEIGKGKIKAVVCMGIDNKKLLEAFTGEVEHIFDTHSLEDAISAAQSVACEGDCILLSPACASFDLFLNYEERGRLFKEAVLGLAK